MEIQKQYPRYIRDQLQMILRQIKRTNYQILIDSSLKECVVRELFCATDFIDMVHYIERQRQFTKQKDNSQIAIKPLETHNESIFQTTTQKRDVNEYLSVLEGNE